MKTLVMYFSRPGQNYMPEGITELAEGNTARVAKIIAESVDADLAEIVPIEPYPNDYMECVERSKAELAANALPAIKPLPEFMYYDVVYLGFPCWCGTFPRPVASAMDQFVTELSPFGQSNTPVIPFITHEGSMFGNSIDDLMRSFPNLALKEGLAVKGSNLDKPGTIEAIADWAKSQSF